MARKPTPRNEFVLFNVIYEDGTQRSNRRVPADLLGGLDGDEPARALIEEQDREISAKSGTAAAVDQEDRPRRRRRQGTRARHAACARAARQQPIGNGAGPAIWVNPRAAGGPRLPARRAPARSSPETRPPPARRPCRAAMPSAASAISTTLSVPKIIGALTWPIWAMRKPLPSDCAERAAEHHAAFLAAVIDQRLRALAVARDHGGHRVGALLRLGHVEADRLPLGPGADRAARRLGEQAVALEHVLEPFGEDHVERGAQREQQMLGRRAAYFW